MVAEIRNGIVVGLTLRECASCETGRKQRISKKALVAISDKMRNLRGKGTFKLPGVRSISRVFGTETGDIFIPIWFWPPIVIIFEPGSFCVGIQVGKFPPGGPETVFCVWCPGLPGICF